MKKKVYNITITLQEYDEDGFWKIFNNSETIDGKKQLIESLEEIVNNCKKYILNRIE